MYTYTIVVGGRGSPGNHPPPQYLLTYSYKENPLTGNNTQQHTRTPNNRQQHTTTVDNSTLIHKITNVPLFKKLWDIIFFWWDNHFMSHYIPQFLKQRDINSYTHPRTSLLYNSSPLVRLSTLAVVLVCDRRKGGSLSTRHLPRNFTLVKTQTSSLGFCCVSSWRFHTVVKPQLKRRFKHA
jgi:hypothetical protein